MSDIDFDFDKIFKKPSESELEECAKNWYYDMRSDKNNFSYWFPKIENCGIKVPRSWWRILAFKEWEELSKCCETSFMTFYDFIGKEVMPNIQDIHNIFMKNGCFSNKFNFNNCTPSHSIESIAINLREIMVNSLMFDTYGDTEIVIRERLYPTKPCLTIYNGMPLQTEFRVFYDFDRHLVLYSSNYWDWDYCYKEISRNPTDALAYKTAYPQILENFTKYQTTVEQMVEDAMASVDMNGQWSIDILYNGTNFYLIDMAEANRSAYYDEDKIAASINK